MFNLCRLLIRSRVRIPDFIANIQTYIALRCRFDSKLQYVAFESPDEGSINLHFEGLGAGESHLHLGLLSGFQMIGELLHAALLILVGALVQRAIPVALGVASAASAAGILPPKFQVLHISLPRNLSICRCLGTTPSPAKPPCATHRPRRKPA